MNEIPKGRIVLLANIVILLLGTIMVLLPFIDEIRSKDYLGNFLLNLGSGFISTGAISMLLQYFIVPSNSIDEKLLKTYTLELVNKLGLTQYKEKIKLYFQSKHISEHSSEIFVKENTIALIKESIVSKTIQVGDRSNVQLDYFIDLMNAVLVDEHNLTQLVCDLKYLIIRHSKDAILKGKPAILFDRIATHKGGNPALALQLAHRMKVPCVFFIQSDNYTNINTVESPIEGEIEAGNKVLIVHDVVATSSRLQPLVDFIKIKRATVEHLFVIVERTDKKLGHERAAKFFEANGIEVHSLFKYNDASLKILKES